MERPAAGPDAADRVFAGVLFDMDGTLVDSIDNVERNWSQWAREHGIDPKAQHALHGIPAVQVVDLVLADRTAAERAQALARVNEIEQTQLDGVHLIAGANAALDLLREHGVPHAIVTSCTPTLARARIGIGLHAPDVLVCAGDTPRGKPDPAPYLLGAERLGVDPRDCLVVEDALAGLQAGRAAGCTTLAVGGTDAGGELAAYSDLVAETIAQVRFVPTGTGVRVTVPGA